MGIHANAKKNNSSMNVPDAYIMIGSISMVRFLRPLADSETGYPGNVPAVQYVARAEIYWDQQSRNEHFGDVVANVAFEFPHVNGQDALHEAYQQINLTGLYGWTLTGQENLL